MQKSQPIKKQITEVVTTEGEEKGAIFTFEM